MENEADAEAEDEKKIVAGWYNIIPLSNKEYKYMKRLDEILKLNETLPDYKNDTSYKNTTKKFYELLKRYPLSNKEYSRFKKLNKALKEYKSNPDYETENEVIGEIYREMNDEYSELFDRYNATKPDTHEKERDLNEKYEKYEKERELNEKNYLDKIVLSGGNSNKSRRSMKSKKSRKCKNYKI